MGRAVSVARPDAAAARRAACFLSIFALMAVDGVNSTLLVVNRGQVMGTYAAIPDEIAWLNTGYLTAKLAAFAVAPWLARRCGMWRATLVGGLLLAVSTAGLAMPSGLWVATMVRTVQGASGALVLVAGQAFVLRTYPTGQQPLLQAMLALAIIVVPVMIAPALHGWATDAYAWQLVAVASSAVAAGAAGAMHLARQSDPPAVTAGTPGGAGLVLLVPAILGGVYVLQEGARFDWFDDDHLVLVAGISALALGAALWTWGRRFAARLFLARALRKPHFVLGLCASCAAGFALFGSATAIPLFGTMVLSLSPEHAGHLALSSSIAAAIGLLAAGALMQYGRIPVEAPIPAGIALFMAGMWLFSLSSAHSGAPDLMLATWLRGFGMGFLFIALTMMTLGHAGRLTLGGVALFNIGRQVGGLAGMAFVLTVFELRLPAHATTLSQYLLPGSPALEAAQATVAGVLQEHGYAAPEAAVASSALLLRVLHTQSAARAFDEIFFTLSAFFLAVIPILVGVKFLLSRTLAGRLRHSG